MIEDETNIPKGASDDVHARIDDVAERVKEQAGAATDAGARGAHRMADKAADWTHRGSAAASDARACTDDLYERACAFVRERPVESMAIALAAGWLVGRVLIPPRR
jgi:ElaB/YqjD/DUF883 family membrane-anchored ribosome-binding protein